MVQGISLLLFILVVLFKIDISWAIFIPIGFLILQLSSGLPFYIFNLHKYEEKLKEVEPDYYKLRNDYHIKFKCKYVKVHRNSLLLVCILNVTTLISYLYLIKLL